MTDVDFSRCIQGVMDSQEKSDTGLISLGSSGQLGCTASADHLPFPDDKQVLSVIVKTGADLRQEQLATQLVERFSKIWKEEGCECWVRLYVLPIMSPPEFADWVVSAS